MRVLVALYATVWAGLLLAAIAAWIGVLDDQKVGGTILGWFALHLLLAIGIGIWQVVRVWMWALGA